MDSRTPLDRDAPGPFGPLRPPPGPGSVRVPRGGGGRRNTSPGWTRLRAPTPSNKARTRAAPPRATRINYRRAPPGRVTVVPRRLRAGARPAPAARDPRRRSLSLRSDTSRPTRHRLQSSIKLSPARPYRSPLDRPSRLDSRLSLAGRAAAASMCLFVSLSSLRLRLLTATSEIVGTSPRPKSASDARQDHLGHPGAHRPAEAFHDELANLVGISSPDPHRLGGRPR